ncbi:glycosyltransferase family 2 protein [Candidatus Woesearchaeota archaeon]|nr:glycosyltransferase family 2 protein [Candidatus Woesearchaeota archaeon]
MIKLSVIIPAYNEERRILPTLYKVNTFLKNKGYDYEILVVDDGSKDETVKIVKKQGIAKIIKNPVNRGKGYSVKHGALAAKKEWVLFTDADSATPIEELEKFKNYAGKYEVLIGSRGMHESNIQVHQPFYRELPGKIFGCLVKLICLKGIHDSQCGFKLFSMRAVQNIFSKQTIDGFGFDVELLFIARKKGFKIKQIPVTWINDAQTKLNIIRDSIRMFRDIILVRINDLKGKYN